MNRKNSINIEAYLLKNIYFVNAVLKKVWILTPEALWIFVGQAGMAIAGLLGIKLLTYVLNSAEYGRLALANTIAALIGTNLFGPLAQGLMRFWAISKDRGNLDVFYAVSNRLAKYLGFAALLTTIIFSFILNIIKSFEWAILITLSLIIGIITGLFSLRIGIFTAARRRKRTAILNISNTFLGPLIATFLAVLIIAKANIALVGYLLAAIFVLLIAERFYYSQIASEASPNYSISNTPAPLSQGLGKEILSYSWPFIVWGVFNWAHVSCDRWSLQTFHGSEVVGAFAVVSLLGTYPLIFGSGFLSTLFAPIAFQRAGSLSDKESIASANKILLLMTTIYILGAIILIGIFTVFHRQLILLISNQRFVKFSYLLPGLTTAWALFFLGQILTSFGLLVNKPQSYIFPKLGASIVAVVTTFYLSWKMGPVGVVWGLALAGFLYSLWCAAIALRLVKSPSILVAGKNEDS